MGFFDSVGAAQAAGRVVRMAPVVFMDVEGDPIRLVARSRDLVLDGVTWTRFPALIDIPSLEILMRGESSRISLGLSGVDPEALQLAVRDQEAVKGRQLRIGIVYFDDDWQPMTSIYWLWTGTMDLVPISRSATERSVAVEAVSVFATRRRAPLGNLTDRDQQLAHPGDRFCERANLYRFSNKKWPKFN